MKIMISQPRYLPTINYLRRVLSSDFFIILDNVQRQSRGFENRNKLFVPDLRWLTIPIKSSSRELLANTYIDFSSPWLEDHIYKINVGYQNHPFYEPDAALKCMTKIEGNDLFVLSMIEHLKNIFAMFDQQFKFVRATELLGSEQGYGPRNLSELLSAIQVESEGIYISGPNGRDYGVKEALSSVAYVKFDETQTGEYQQFNQKLFTPNLPFLDFLFNCGRDALIEELSKPLELEDE
jgi:hypothetical protein